MPPHAQKGSTEKETQNCEPAKEEEEEEVISENEPDSEDEDLDAETDNEEDPFRMDPEPEGPPAAIVENTQELTDEQQEQLATLKSKVAEAMEVSRFGVSTFLPQCFILF